MAADSKGPAGAATVLLAAGQSTRMGPENKLLKEIAPGIPVIRAALERALACGPSPVHVVTGHEAGRIHTALAGLDCRFVHNPGYAGGLSGSIRAGFRAATETGASGVLVLLGDMPWLPGEAIAAVMDAAAAAPDRIVQAVHGGKPAHPVWLPARIGDLVERLDGDRGVRGLARELGEEMVAVDVGEAAMFDLDTPQDFAAAAAANTPARGH